MRENKKDIILKTAARHFSKKGYDTSSLEEIATECGISKAAIYYHFKGKAALYEAILLHRLSYLSKTLNEAVFSKNSIKEKLFAYIETFGSFLKENSCFAAILAHEFADRGNHMPPTAIKELSKTLTLVTAILNEGIKEDIFEMENPMAIQMMIVSTLIMHQTTRNLREKVTKCVETNFTILPEPDIENLSKILSKNIYKAIKKAKR
jgi:AcrR family transcriptional regulator